MAKYTREADREPEEQVIGYTIQRGIPQSSSTEGHQHYFIQQGREEARADFDRKRKRYMADAKRTRDLLRQNQEATVQYLGDRLLESEQREKVSGQAAEETQKNLLQAQKELKRARRKYNSGIREANKRADDVAAERDSAEAEELRSHGPAGAIPLYQELSARVDAHERSETNYMNIIQQLIGSLGEFHVKPGDNLELEAIAMEKDSGLRRLLQSHASLRDDNASLQADREALKAAYDALEEKMDAMENTLCTSMERKEKEYQRVIAEMDEEIKLLNAERAELTHDLEGIRDALK